MPTPDVPTTEERDRALDALALRRSGLAYREIAHRLSYRDESGPRRAISRLLDRVESEGVAELRALEDDRLDALLAACWQAAVAGDLDAIKTALGIHDRRVKLHGLAAPVAIDVGLGAATDVEWAEQVAALFTRLEISTASVEAIGTAGGELGRQVAAVIRDPRLDAGERSEAPEGEDTRHPLHPASGPLSAGSADLRPAGWSNL